MSRTGGFVVSVVGVIVAALIGWQMSPLLGDRAPLLLFVLPVVAASLSGGLGPGLLATIFGGIVGGYLFLPPRELVGGDPIGSALWVLVCIIVSLLGDRSLTDKRRLLDAQTRLVSKRMRLSATLDAAIDAIVTMDSDGRIVDSNPAVSDLFGYEQREIHGRKAEILLAPENHTIFQRLRENRDAVGEHGLVDKAHEVVGVRKDGGRFTLDVGISEASIGGEPHFIAIMRDIEEKKEAERRLLDTNERLRLALSAGKLGIWEMEVHSGDCTIDTAVRELFDLDRLRLPFEEVSRRIHPEDRDRVRAGLEKTIATADEFAAEFRVVHRDGSVRWLGGQGKAVPDEHGAASRLLGINYDITERKRFEIERDELLESERLARSQAEEMSRIKENFLSVLSHELRSPLNSILGWAAILRRKLADMPAERDAVITIERNARAQAALIETMLDETRLTEGKVKLDLRPLSLVELAENAVRSAEPLAAPKAIRLSIALPPEGAACVRADQTRLQQVLSNLISNAIKFTQAGGEVAVTVFERGEFGGVTVRDSGTGIPKEELPGIFERFRQVGRDSGRHGGLGLGLSICKQIVDLHRGRIWAESEGEGKGSTFGFEIPSAMTHGKHVSEAESDLSGIRVLVVDDEPEARDLLRRLLREFRADVLLASSASEALEIARREHPDVMLADISMPGKDGFGLIRELRELRDDDTARTTPAAVVSALNRQEDRRRSESAGYQRYLTKPINVAEVVHTVATLAARST